ncbi:MAG: NERD domain-containing protein [Pygmaiobacter sp.]|jgi:hypothetical protein|nr:NERD domain-containing protein [Pygmaiobacter sp.]
MNTTAILNIAGAIVVLAIVLLVFFFILRSQNDDGPRPDKHKPHTDGGVAKMVAALGRYASMHGFVMIAPAALQGKEKECQLDAVLVTYAGVIGVRCMGHNGEIFANTGESDWLWVTSKGRSPLPDPVAQGAADVRVLRDVLMQNGKGALRNIPVECLTVFTDKTVQLAVPKSTPIYRRKELLSLLESEKYLQDKGIDLPAVAAALKSAAGAQ